MDPKKVVMTPPEMQRATEEIMRDLGAGIHRALDAYFPNSGFALVVFQLSTPNICNYISDAGRDSMIEALKETTKKLEADEGIPPAGSAVH